MSRLTEWVDDHAIPRPDIRNNGHQRCIDKLARYEDLEDQLEKLYGDRLSLDKVVENLNRVVQNGEEKLDLARILTNAEAEK